MVAPLDDASLMGPLYSRRLTSVLALWLAVGVAWLLLGMFVLTTSKLYQHGLHLFLMAPGLLAFILLSSLRRGWDGLLLLLLTLCITWAVLSLLWGGDITVLKRVLYIGLAANAFVALAGLNPSLFWRVLACSALCGGWLGWFALLSFYVLQGNPPASRVIGTGLLDHTILASHVVGLLGVMLFFMREYLSQALRGWPRWIGILGCLAFLLMSRSKGPLLALLVCLLLSYAWLPSRKSLVAGLGTIFAAILAVWIWPEQFLRGGVSFRPQLLQVAWEQLLASPWLGLGAGHAYLLPVPAAGQSYEHAHNLYVHMAIQLGVPGLALWLGLQVAVVARGWAARHSTAGQMLCAIWAFAAVALFTDGIGPWLKPREEWFTVWLPVFVALALMASQRQRPVVASDPEVQV